MGVPVLPLDPELDPELDPDPEEPLEVAPDELAALDEADDAVPLDPDPDDEPDEPDEDEAAEDDEADEDAEEDDEDEDDEDEDDEDEEDDDDEDAVVVEVVVLPVLPTGAAAPEQAPSTQRAVTLPTARLPCPQLLTARMCAPWLEGLSRSRHSPGQKHKTLPLRRGGGAATLPMMRHGQSLRGHPPAGHRGHG
jgi:hypothetical protein